MKNTSRNKLLLCFRPVVDMDVMLESRGVLRSSNNRGMLSECESFRDKGIAKTSATKSVSSDDGFSGKSSNLALHRPPPNRKLSRFIKAVVFQTLQRRRARGIQRQSKCIKNNDIGEVKHMIRSPNSSSSSASNISSRIASKVNEVKQIQSKSRVKAAVNKKTPEIDCYILYVVLAVMIFTVFWSKLGGILCTTIWLYCHPRRQSSYIRQTNGSTISSQRQRVQRL